MSIRRRTAIVALLLLVALAVLSGCAARQGGGEVVGQAGEGEIAVDLPAIVIDIDADGNPSVAGVPLADLGVVPTDVVAQLTLPPETIQQLQDANIQNLQVNNMTDGLQFYVNGQEIPSITWDKESLGALSTFATELGAAEGGEQMAVLGKLAPMLTNLGFAAVLKFHAVDGAADAPIYAEGAAAQELQAAAEAYQSEVGAPALINIPVTYTDSGDWTVSGISAAEWEALTGAPFTALQMQEDIVPALKAAGVSEMSVSATEDGLALTINGTALPYLDWSGGKLASVVELALAAGMLDSPDMDSDALVSLLEQLLPVVTSSNIKFNVFLE